MNEKDTNPKDRLGVQRPPLSTVSGPVLFEIGAAMLEGAAKYGRHNYRVAGVRSSVYFDATMRHLWAWWEGQDIDPDSGMSHVAKAIASLVVLRDAQIHGKVDNDDRPPPTDERWLADIRERVKTILETYPDGPAPYTAASVDPVYKQEYLGEFVNHEREVEQLRAEERALFYEPKILEPEDYHDED